MEINSLYRPKEFGSNQDSLPDAHEITESVQRSINKAKLYPDYASLPKGAKRLLQFISSPYSYNRYFDDSLEDDHVLNILNDRLEEASNLASVTGNLQILCRNGYLSGRWFQYDDRSQRVRFLNVLVDHDTCVAEPHKQPPPPDSMRKTLQISDNLMSEYTTQAFCHLSDEELEKKYSYVSGFCDSLDRLLSNYLCSPSTRDEILRRREACTEYIAALEALSTYRSFE